MAVVSCDEIWEGRQGSTKRDGSRAYTRVFLVLTDDPLDDALVVLEADGLPWEDASWETDTGVDGNLWVQERKPVQDNEDPRKWTVEIQYSDQVPKLAMDPVLSWTDATEREVLWTDIEGDAITTSASEVFDPPPEVDSPRARLSVTFYDRTYTPQDYAEYYRTVNEDEFEGCDAGTVRFISSSASQEQDGADTIWKVTLQFMYNPDGWHYRPLDAGYVQLSANGQERIRDAYGHPVSKPALLDGFGFALENPSPDTAVFLDFTIYEDADYSALY